MSIATVLSDAIAQSDMTQKALADQVGVLQSYISQICAGKKTPTVHTLTQISECLGISVTRFFQEESADGDPRRGPSTRNGRMNLSEDEKQLIRFYRTMDRRNRAVLKGIVSSINGL